ncbi:hypothetical protein D3C75_1236490 [compost metagenome]
MQPLVEGGRPAEVHSPLDCLNGPFGSGAQIPGQLNGSIKQRIRSNHFVDITYFERFLWRHRSAFKHQHKRAMGADQPW